MPGAEILLVEDDDLNQALVPAILARSDQPYLRDAHVTVAGTLAQARAVLAERHVDLVLLDMRLPDGSGLPLATELRDQPGQSVAVIALTGAPAEHGDDALAAGCVAVLGKPYSLGELREVVAAHLPCGGTVPEQAAAAQEAAAAPGAGAQMPSADASWAGMREPPAVAGPGPQEPPVAQEAGPQEPSVAPGPGPQGPAADRGTGHSAAIPAARPPEPAVPPSLGRRSRPSPPSLGRKRHSCRRRASRARR